MKLKYFCYTAAMAALPILMAACSDFEKDRTYVIDLNLSSDAISFEAAPSSDQDQTIQAETDAPWKVKIDQSIEQWLTISPMEGTGNATLTFHADKNKDPHAVR